MKKRRGGRDPPRPVRSETESLAFSLNDLVHSLGGLFCVGFDEDLSAEHAFERSEELLHERDPGVRVWYLPRASRRNPVELDAETLQYLRALGYIE